MDIKKENVELLLDTPFIRVFDLKYAPGKYYYDATRRRLEDIAATMTDEEFRGSVPDAVTCIVIIKEKDKEPVLLMPREFRYPVGRFVLSPPAGLLDPGDKGSKEPLLSAAKREIREETGLTVKDTDRIFVCNPGLFSTPGMTDECNGMVCAVIEVEDLTELSQQGARGSELFDGFTFIDRHAAREMLSTGRDADGFYYSVHIWGSLLYFLSGMWEQ